MPEYQRYMQAYAAALSGFVERGGLLLQLAQSAEAEAAPPFLPATLMARRGPGEPSRARVRVDHPLLAEWPSAAWDADGDVFVAHADRLASPPFFAPGDPPSSIVSRAPT